MCALLNVFIFLIEDAFLLARRLDAESKQDRSVDLKTLVKLLDDNDLESERESGEFEPLISENGLMVPQRAGAIPLQAEKNDDLLDELFRKQREMEELLQRLARRST